MKNAVIITCNNNYVPYSIIAINQFTKYNKGYGKYIIGTKFTREMKLLCIQYDIKIIEINLSSDFININKRPYGLNYPIECFYHLYAYKLLSDFDYIVKIEPDVYTNRMIDIDFNSVEYIGGSYIEYYYVNKFPPIIKDLKKIKTIYPNARTDIYRLCSGVNIYNVKGLTQIKFYETIIKYYKESWEINAPRCGDDSLLLLYIMINPSHIKFLKPEFNIIQPARGNILNKDYIDMIIFYHNYRVKYWNVNNINTMKLSDRYFYDCNIEYINNNMPIDFIKKYIPNIYVDISNIIIPFCYYNMNNNFGDIITPYYLKKFCNINEYTFNFDVKSPKIISCGSIMRYCNNDTIVYGSGIRDINQSINKGTIKIIRGPLTQKRLKDIGCYCPPTYGDPGLLLPIYYNPTITKKYKLGIIPHHIHYDIIKNKYNMMENINIINLLNDDIEIIINEILSCEKIISSSLHGLIVSDAYNIPNKWLNYDNMINGDGTKFYDYFMSVKRKDTSYIDNINNLNEMYDIIEDVNIKFNINKLKEEMFFDENGIKNYTKYLWCIVNKVNKKIINKSLKINDRWYAFKKHWVRNRDKLICIEETYVKKEVLHTKYLSDDKKYKININDKVKIITDYNSVYYIVSLENI